MICTVDTPGEGLPTAEAVNRVNVAGIEKCTFLTEKGSWHGVVVASTFQEQEGAVVGAPTTGENLPSLHALSPAQHA